MVSHIYIALVANSTVGYGWSMVSKHESSVHQVITGLLILLGPFLVVVLLIDRFENFATAHISTSISTVCTEKKNIPFPYI